MLVLDWASPGIKKLCSQLFRDYLKSGSSTEDDLSMQLGDEPNPELFFFKSVIVSVFERSAPADQRRGAASAFRSLTQMIISSSDGILGGRLTRVGTMTHTRPCACRGRQMLPGEKPHSYEIESVEDPKKSREGSLLKNHNSKSSLGCCAVAHRSAARNSDPWQLLEDTKKNRCRAQLVVTGGTHWMAATGAIKLSGAVA